MADSGAAEALPEEEIAEVEGLKEWERINCAGYINDSSPTGCSLIAIRDISADEAPDNPIVFPPANHENLHASASLIHHFIPQHQNHMKPSFSSLYPPPPWESSSSSSSLSSRSQFGVENDNLSYSFPPSESQLAEPEKSLPDSPIPLAKSTVDPESWWRFVLKVLHSKFNGIEQFFRYISRVSRAIVSFTSPIGRATVAVGVVMFLHFRWRRRLNCGGESKKQLIRMIEQKDEVQFLINFLLLSTLSVCENANEPPQKKRLISLIRFLK